MDKVIASDIGREARYDKVADVSDGVLLGLVDQLNEYVIAGLCGDDDLVDRWNRIITGLRAAGLADS